MTGVGQPSKRKKPRRSGIGTDVDPRDMHDGMPTDTGRMTRQLLRYLRDVPAPPKPDYNESSDEGTGPDTNRKRKKPAVKRAAKNDEAEPNNNTNHVEAEDASPVHGSPLSELSEIDSDTFGDDVFGHDKGKEPNEPMDERSDDGLGLGDDGLGLGDDEPDVFGHDTLMDGLEFNVNQNNDVGDVQVPLLSPSAPQQHQIDDAAVANIVDNALKKQQETYEERLAALEARLATFSAQVPIHVPDQVPTQQTVEQAVENNIQPSSSTRKKKQKIVEAVMAAKRTIPCVGCTRKMAAVGDSAEAIAAIDVCHYQGAPKSKMCYECRTSRRRCDNIKNGHEEIQALAVQTMKIIDRVKNGEPKINTADREVFREVLIKLREAGYPASWLPRAEK